jgi:hypothetical protein
LNFGRFIWKPEEVIGIDFELMRVEGELEGMERSLAWVEVA